MKRDSCNRLCLSSVKLCQACCWADVRLVTRHTFKPGAVTQTTVLHLCSKPAMLSHLDRFHSRNIIQLIIRTACVFVRRFTSVSTKFVC
jgi:hypothetical protein